MTVIREMCGTKAGMLAHQAAGESLCGTCAYTEQARRIAAEGIPSRPTPPGWLPPVTADEAEQHALVLDRETEAYEIEHRHEQRKRGGRKPTHLRPVA